MTQAAVTDPALPATVARRTFSSRDQTWFATLSGDHNPIHLDPVAARRTQAGGVVVHGVHTLLWCLDALASRFEPWARLQSIRVRFEEMLFVGDRPEALLTQIDARGFRAEVRVEGLVAVRLSGVFGDPKPAVEAAARAPEPLVATALDLDLDGMAASAACVPLAADRDALAAAFPALTALWSAGRLAALCASTYVVGMVCPGLHSIFGGLSFEAVEPADPADGLNFHTTTVDPRFRLVRMAMAGGGLRGTVESFARMPPTAQPSLVEVAGRVEADAFAGARALVVGGSRGLGEIVAKILVAGGALVTITYASGQADALRVKREIEAFGGRCEVLAYNALEPAAPQLAGADFDTVYYFATPTIARRTSGGFSRERFAVFAAFYLEGFSALCQAVIAARPAGVSAFYPSTSFIDERPDKMTEYAMAKAAGEVLCADLQSQNRGLRVSSRRVPRLRTDQTAAIMAVEAGEPLDYFLPVVREVHDRRPA